MAEPPSMMTFAGARDGQQKFDYFVTGLTGALFAYVAQTYVPKRIGFDAATLEPLALTFLAASFFLGLRRIETTIRVMSLNHEMLDSSEKAGRMTEAMAKGVTRGFNPHSGAFIEPGEIPRRRAELMSRARAAEKALLKAIERGSTHYKSRNLLLVGGFAAFILSKVFAPYA